MSQNVFSIIGSHIYVNICEWELGDNIFDGTPTEIRIYSIASIQKSSAMDYSVIIKTFHFQICHNTVSTVLYVAQNYNYLHTLHKILQ